MKKITLVLLLLSIISCTKEIEVDIPSEKPSLVVYSTLSMPPMEHDPTLLDIQIQSTNHIYDTNIRYVKDAEVYLYKKGKMLDFISNYDTLNNIYRLIPDIDMVFYDDTIIVSEVLLDKYYPKKGDKYSLKVKKEGYETVSASTTIPSKVEITDAVVNPIAYIDDLGSAFSEISITFTDSAEEINYYEVLVSRSTRSDYEYIIHDRLFRLTTHNNLITAECYYPSLIRFDVRKPKYLLFSDKTIRGEEVILNIYYTPPQFEYDKRYITDHSINIHLRNVTKEYYKFKTTKLQHLYSKQEDMLYGTGEPLDVISNIENGYGLFAGFNEDVVSKRIEEVIVSE